MATRYFPVSVAVPKHLDHKTDTELIATLNRAIDLGAQRTDLDGGEPIVLVSLSPEQFVVAQPGAAEGIRDAMPRRPRGKKARR